MSKTIYCGSGKIIATEKGRFRAISINLTDLPREHMFTYMGKTYIKLNVNDKPEVDEHGKDVSVSVNTWKPE